MPVKSKKKRGQQEPNIVRFVIAGLLSLAARYTGVLIRSAATVACAWLAVQGLATFSGKTTVANVVLAVTAHLNVSIVLSMSLAGVTSLLFFLEVKSHRRTKKRLADRIKLLEKDFDPSREGSLLIEDGPDQEDED